MSDPREYRDLGADPSFEPERARLLDAIFHWARHPANRITRSDAAIMSRDAAGRAYDRGVDSGILIGYWDEADLAQERARRDQFRQQSAPPSPPPDGKPRTS